MENVEREEITVLSRASSKGNSLKTTVPMSIVKHLKLKEKDRLKWEIKPKDNEFLVIVIPLRKSHGKDEK